MHIHHFQEIGDVVLLHIFRSQAFDVSAIIAHHVCAQPVHQPKRIAKWRARGLAVLTRPAGHLPLEIIARFAEIAQAPKSP